MPKTVQIAGLLGDTVVDVPSKDMTMYANDASLL